MPIAIKIKTVLMLVITFILFIGCATYPKTREEQAAYYAEEARSSIEKKDIAKVGYQIELALEQPTGNERIRALFISHPLGREYYYTYLEKRITDIYNPLQASSVLEQLSTAQNANIFSEAQINNLSALLNKVVVDGNLSGSILFDLNDPFERFEALKNFNHKQIILDRSIKKLQSNTSGERPIKQLIDYVKTIGVESEEGKRIESLLPTFNIRRNELDLVASIFPVFANNRRQKLTIPVFFQIKGGDRLLKEDLLNAFRKEIKGVEWGVLTQDPKTMTLTVECLRHEEKTLPERSQTITYAQHEVDLMSAALLMPRNASYIYDVISGGAEIEYGYVVSAEMDGKKSQDEIVRGKLQREYSRCQNERIQNVFGGVSSAGFIANNDMQKRCSGRESVSMDELRNDVFFEIVKSVLKIPEIKAVHDLN